MGVVGPVAARALREGLRAPVADAANDAALVHDVQGGAAHEVLDVDLQVHQLGVCCSEDSTHIFRVVRSDADHLVERHGADCRTAPPAQDTCAGPAVPRSTELASSRVSPFPCFPPPPAFHPLCLPPSVFLASYVLESCKLLSSHPLFVFPISISQIVKSAHIADAAPPYILTAALTGAISGDSLVLRGRPGLHGQPPKERCAPVPPLSFLPVLRMYLLQNPAPHRRFVATHG